METKKVRIIFIMVALVTLASFLGLMAALQDGHWLRITLALIGFAVFLFFSTMVFKHNRKQLEKKQ